MTKYREILRLNSLGFSERNIALEYSSRQFLCYRKNKNSWPSPAKMKGSHPLPGNIRTSRQELKSTQTQNQMSSKIPVSIPNLMEILHP